MSLQDVNNPIAEIDKDYALAEESGSHRREPEAKNVSIWKRCMAKRAVFLFVFLFLFGSFVWAEEKFAPTFHQCVDEWAANAGNQNPDQKDLVVGKLFESHTLCIIRAIDHHNGFFAVVAAFIIAWLTITLAGVGRQQILDTRTLQRAYLNVLPAGIEPYRSGDGRLSCDVYFENFGNLPAGSVTWYINQKFSDSGELRDEDFPIDAREFSGNNLIRLVEESERAVPR